ncbi:MAG TPA: hypothetical protein VNQ52_00745 [Microbacteriaceae bacterium]|nr:hypothetical protein [Microbacteriaceae bacterium]
MRLRRLPSRHVCLASRDIATVEHLGAIADQARAAEFDVCWLDLGDQADVRSAIRQWAEPTAEPLRTPNRSALQRHLRATRSEAIWLQTPYPEHYPEWFWETAGGRLAYAGYGLTLSTWNEGLYGLETYRKARWLITESESDRSGYLQFGVQPDRVRAFGNPLLHVLRSRDGNVRAREHDLLWAPHWTEEWFGGSGFSTWRETAPAIREFAGANPGIRVRVRPHPLLPAAIDRAERGDVGTQSYLSLLDLPNVSVSAGRLLDDIESSRALVTDGVSIIAYWASTGRPLGITRSDLSPRFNDAGERLVAAADQLSTPEQLHDWLDGLRDAADSEERRALSQQLHPTFDESPIELWADYSATAAKGPRQRNAT